MTRNEAIEKHRKMWGWLADHPGATKWHYLVKHDPYAVLRGNCYLCGYAGGHCESCPLCWPYGGCITDDGCGLYERYLIAESWEQYDIAGKIAKLISMLPGCGDATEGKEMGAG